MDLQGKVYNELGNLYSGTLTVTLYNDDTGATITGVTNPVTTSNGTWSFTGLTNTVKYRVEVASGNYKRIIVPGKVQFLDTVITGDLVVTGSITGGGIVPVGSIVQYAGASAPTGWLLCQGQSLVRADYAALFGVLSTTWGAADGTHFNVPDLRGKVAIGVSDSHALGTSGGAETVTLDTTQIPSHQHTIDSQGEHAHTIPGVGLNSSGGSAGFTYAPTASAVSVSTGTVSAHTHTAQATGGGLAHANMQPYATMNYIIKY
jgi:microcystin-dependent protein